MCCAIQTTVGTNVWNTENTLNNSPISILDAVILFIFGHHVKVYGATRKVTYTQAKEQIPSVDLKLVHMRA